MSNDTREHLSSLMDGEISRDASRFLVRRLGSDKELCSTWARYHVVRDCLRNPDGGYARDDLCSRVRDAIDREDAPLPRSHTVSGPTEETMLLALCFCSVG